MRLDLIGASRASFVPWLYSRGSDSALSVPSAPEAGEQGGGGYPVFFGGDGYAHRPSINLDDSVGSSIRPLFLFRGPFAVFLAIRPLILLPLKRMLRRGPLAHVGEEVLKAARDLIPPFAYANSPASVSVIVGALGLVASSAHIYPDAVFRRAFHSVLCVMVRLFHA